MVKLITVLVLASLACRLLLRRWPWQLLALAPRVRDDDDARRLLGVHRSAKREDILDAHRKLVARVHPDKGGTADQVIAANSARDLLLARLGKPKQE